MVDYNKESIADFRARMIRQAESGEPLSAHDEVTISRMEFCYAVVKELGDEFTGDRASWRILTAASVVAIPWAEEKN